MVYGISRGNGIDDAGNIDTDLPAGDRVDRFVPDGVFAKVIAVVDTDDVVGRIDSVSHRISLRDLLELGSSVVNHFRDFLGLAGDFHGLRDVSVSHRFLRLGGSLNVRQNAFLTVLGVHLVEAGGKFVGGDEFPGIVALVVNVPAAGQKHVEPGIGGAVEEVVVRVLRVHDVGPLHVLVSGDSVDRYEFRGLGDHDDFRNYGGDGILEAFLFLIRKLERLAVTLDFIRDFGDQEKVALKIGSREPVVGALQVVAVLRGVEDQAERRVGDRFVFSGIVQFAHNGRAVDLHQNRRVGDAEDLGGIVQKLSLVPCLGGLFLFEAQNVVEVQGHFHRLKGVLQIGGVGYLHILRVRAFELGDPHAVADDLAVDGVVAGKRRDPDRAVDRLVGCGGFLDRHSGAELEVVAGKKLHAGLKDLEGRSFRFNLAGPV